MLFSVHRSLVLLLLLILFLRQKAKNLRAPPLAACFQELWGDSPESTDGPSTLTCFINSSMVIGVQRVRSRAERSAELSCFACQKQVFPAFGSCNGHVTAITSEAELNVKGKFLLLSYCCSEILLLFCCYCSTLQHCSALNVGVL